MNMVKLISEAVEDVEFITEEKKGGKSYKIRGIFMQADVKNRNGRVYPMEILTNPLRVEGVFLELDVVGILPA